MSFDREAISVALFNRLSAALPQMKTKLRRPMGWENCPEQPAMILVKSGESAVAQMGMPTVWEMRYEVVIYTQRAEDPSEAHDTQQNQLLAAVEAAMERTPAEAAQAGPFVNDGQDPYTTLGGLVAYCRINGQVDSDGGGLGQQGVLIIPLELKTTA